VEADLSNEVPVRIRQLPPAASGARYVRLGFSALGFELPPSRSAPLEETPGGGLRAAVDAKRVRVLVSGKVTGELRFLDARKRELRTDEFRLRAERSGFLAANGVFGLLALAFVLSYAWSLSLPLRRGHRATSAFVGMAILGGVAGAAVADIVWAFGGPQLTWATLLVATALGVGVFVALARSVQIIGRRRRLVRARARQEAPSEESEAEPPPAAVPGPSGARETAVPGASGARETAVPGAPGEPSTDEDSPTPEAESDDSSAADDPQAPRRDPSDTPEDSS
jgi:hypothetical protein